MFSDLDCILCGFFVGFFRWFFSLDGGVQYIIVLYQEEEEEDEGEREGTGRKRNGVGVRETNVLREFLSEMMRMREVMDDG